MKKVVGMLLLFIVGLFYATEIMAVGCNRTGLRLVPAGTSGMVYFYGAPSTTSKFPAKYLYLELSATATESVQIRRWVQSGWSGSPMEAIDDSLALTLVPGQRRILIGDGVVAFRWVGAVATGTFIYDASNCDTPPAEWSTVDITMGTTIDSLVTLLSEPPPVTVSESNVFTGLTLNSRSVGSATNLKAAAYRTFPPTAGVDVHGAKALYLVIDWTDFKHGGFQVQHKFAPSATDTSFYYHDGAVWSSADTIGLSDSTGALAGTPRGVAGSVVLRIPDVPGAGYYFCKIIAYGVAARDTIGPLSGTLVKVE